MSWMERNSVDVYIVVLSISFTLAYLLVYNVLGRFQQSKKKTKGCFVNGRSHNDVKKKLEVSIFQYAFVVWLGFQDQ